MQLVEGWPVEEVLQRGQGGGGRDGLLGRGRGRLRALIGDHQRQGTQQVGLAIECAHPQSYFRVSGMKG